MATLDEQFKRLGIEPKKCKTNISYKLENSSDKLENVSVDILHLVDDTNDPHLSTGVSPSGLTPSSAAQPAASRVAKGQKESVPGFRSPKITYLALSRVRRANTDRVRINVSMRTDQMHGPGFQHLVFKLTPRRDEFPKNIPNYNLWPYYQDCYNTTRGTSRTVLIGKGLSGKKWGTKRTPDILVPRTAMSLDLEANLVTLWIEDQVFRDIQLEPCDTKHYTHKAYVEIDYIAATAASVWDLEVR